MSKKNQKSNPQKVVEQCEAIFKENKMGGVVVAMDDNDGYYGLTMPPESLFQWNEDESKVRLALDEATEEQINEEFHTLTTLDKMVNYVARSLEALGNLLTEAVKPAAPKVKDNRYDN